MNPKLELLKGVDRLTRHQLSELRARLVGLRESSVVALPQASRSGREALRGRLAGRAIDPRTIDTVLLPALDEIETLIPAIEEIGYARQSPISQDRFEPVADNVYRIIFDRTNARNDPLLSGSLLRAIRAFAALLPVWTIELRQMAVTLEDVAIMPVSYTHLDVYKRQMLQQSYRDFLFDQTIG